MPLPRRPSGIETFRVEGAIDSDPVSAVWDGRWAVVSRVLADHVALAIAVDEAFADSGIPPSFEHQPDPGIKRRDLLIGLHVLNGQRDLVGHIPQEVRIGI